MAANAKPADYNIGKIESASSVLNEFMNQKSKGFEEEKPSFFSKSKVEVTNQWKRYHLQKISAFQQEMGGLDAELNTIMLPAGSDEKYMENLANARENITRLRQKQIRAITDFGTDLMKDLKDMEDAKVQDSYKNLISDFITTCGKLGTKMQYQQTGIQMMFDHLQQNHTGASRNLPGTEAGAKSWKAAAEEYKPGTLDVNTMKAFGSGGINTVYSYQDPVAGKERIVKIGSQHLFENMSNQNAAGVFDTRLKAEATQNMETGFVDMYFINSANRDVAMTRMDELLGFGIVTRTDFAVTPEGMPLSVMDKAPGKVVDDYRFTLGEPQEGVISVKNQEFIKQIFELEALDVIAGHVDRHAGNYMMDVAPDGKIKIQAIDNDTSFSLNIVGYNKNVDSETGGIRPDYDTAFPLVPEHVYNSVMALNKERLQQGLGALLDQNQVDRVNERLEELQKRFTKLQNEGKVVRGDFTPQQIETLYEKLPVQGPSDPNYGSYHRYIAHILGPKNERRHQKALAEAAQAQAAQAQAKQAQPQAAQAQEKQAQPQVQAAQPQAAPHRRELNPSEFIRSEKPKEKTKEERALKAGQHRMERQQTRARSNTVFNNAPFEPRPEQTSQQKWKNAVMPTEKKDQGKSL